MVKGTHQAKEDPRNKDVQIFINGTFYARDEARISVFDSGYLVGDGVWEAFRVHKGKLVFIDDHLDRLWQSAKVTGIMLPFSRETLIAHVQETLSVNGMWDHIHVRVMVTRGIKKTPSQDPRLTISGPNLVIIAEHKQAAVESKKEGIRLFTSTFRRGSPDYLDPRLNCHSKLHEVQALIQAIEAGADEALMLDTHGFVATCNATNFFMVKDGEVWTSTGQYCMNGITRGKVLAVCAKQNVPCFQKNFSLFDVYGADEAFVTGTFGGLTPVVKIDGKPIGTSGAGPITRQLSNWYEQWIEREIQA
ncbi:aminotransferase class IV [Cyclobacterium xiamenense]|jgi:branched-chain amino acid aminotransferase|uniref:aminotransferase class IV n=1 Tax=Cyclobacterium xiamenense TaxID=1297121 RepID=UPI0035CF3771